MGRCRIKINQTTKIASRCDLHSYRHCQEPITTIPFAFHGLNACLTLHCTAFTGVSMSRIVHKSARAFAIGKDFILPLSFMLVSCSFVALSFLLSLLSAPHPLYLDGWRIRVCVGTCTPFPSPFPQPSSLGCCLCIYRFFSPDTPNSEPPLLPGGGRGWTRWGLAVQAAQRAHTARSG